MRYQERRLTRPGNPGDGSAPTSERTDDTRRGYERAAGDTPEPVLRASWVFGAALTVLAINFAVPKIAVLLAMGLAVWVVWTARPEYFPALIVAQFSRATFFPKTYDEFASSTISFGGIGLTVAYVTGAAMTARVVYEFSTQSTFRQSSASWLVWFWLLAIPPALAMAVMGKLEGNPTWTSTVRTVLAAGAFFYGIILRRTWPEDGRVTYRWFLPMVTVACLFVPLNLAHHEFSFLFLPYAVPLGVLAVKRRGAGWKMLGLLCIGLAFNAALGLGLRGAFQGGPEIGLGYGVASNAAVGGALGGSTTFTRNSLLLASTVLSVVYFLPFGRLRELVGRTLQFGAFPALVVFSVTIAVLSPRYTSIGRVQTETLDVLGKIRYKLFDDRSIIWHGTLEDIMQPPYVLRPASRATIIKHPLLGVIEWPAGAHNVVLETMKSLRWVAGSALLAILAVALARSARALYSSISPALAVFAIGTLAQVPACVSGHYPLSEGGSLLFLGLAGLVGSLGGGVVDGENSRRRAAYRR